MTTEITAEFKDDEVKQFLDKLNKNLKAIDKKKFGKIAAGFGTVIFADVQRHFREALGPDGPWEKWSDLYAERQKKLGKSWPGNALKFSGFLRNNFKPTNYKQGKDGLFWFNNAQTKSGFPYAYAHDNDTDSRSTLPRRSFMWLSKDGFDKISQIAIDALVEKEWG